MATSDNLSAQRYAANAAVSAAEAKSYADYTRLAEDFSKQANESASEAKVSQESAADSAIESENARDIAISQTVRSLRVQDGETLSVLPSADSRKGKFPGFDSVTGDVKLIDISSTDATGLALSLASEGGSDLIGTTNGTVEERFNNVDSVLSDKASIDALSEKISGTVTFTGGGILKSEKDFIYNNEDLSWYYWSGSYGDTGKEVFPDSTPEGAGGVGLGKWLNAGDTVLRSELSSLDGGSLVSVGDYTVSSIITETKYRRISTFQDGGVLHQSNEVFRYGNEWFAYRGIIPSDGVIINPGSIPSNAEWISVGDGNMPIGSHTLYGFGAIDDNGTTDNRAAIQKAIEYMEFSGSVLYVNSSADDRYFGVSSLHPDYSDGYALVLKKPRNVKIIGDRNRNSSIKYTGSASGMAMLAIVAPASDWGMTITSLGISAGNKLNHCLYGVNVWYAQNDLEGGCYEDAVLDGIHVSMYMSRLARVFTNNNGRDGLSFGGPLTDGGYTAGTSTSLSLDNCWSRGSGRYGYFCANELWYSEWSSLGCDGVPGLRTPVAYALTNAKGVTLSGIGAEQCIKLMVIGSFRGFNVNGIQMSNVGPETGSVDYCIELFSGFSATFSGFAPEGQFDSKFTYTLFVSNATGNEFVTILDKSIKSEKIGHMKANPTGFYNFPEIVGYAVSRSQDRGFPRTGNTLNTPSGTTVTPQSTGVPGTIIQREAVIRIEGPGNVSIYSTPGSTNFTAYVDVTCVIKSGSNATPQAVARQWVSTKVDGTLKLHGSLGTPQAGWSFDNPAGGGLIGVVDNTPGIVREFLVRVRFVSTDSSGINFAI